MDLDVGQVVAQPPDPGAGDQLTIVELDALEVVAGDEVVEGGVRDQGQVVQLENIQVFRGARCQPQLADALVGNQFTMGEADGLEPRTTRAQDAQGGVRDEDALLQVHLLEEVAAPGQGREARVREGRDGGALEGAQLGTVLG